MKKIFTLLVAMLTVMVSYAVPARPVWQMQTQPDGTQVEVRLVGDESCHYWVNRDGEQVRENAEGYWVTEAKKANMAKKTKGITKPMKAIGDKNFAPRGLVILVNYKDVSYKSENTLDGFKEMLNGANYTYNSATGSVGKYFSDQSNGKYTPEFDVYGPVTLPKNMSYYGGNDSEGYDKKPGDMIVEACSIANALHEVDFTRYDNDNDGYVDFVYVIYAGKGEAAGGAANTIWPHAWDLESAYEYNNNSYSTSQRKFDGKTVLNYACSSELNYDGSRDGIGTITHEFSHVIGLPDLYDTSVAENYATPGSWHIMDYGSYNNEGNTPPNYTIYDKYYLGWIPPENPGNEAQVLTMAAGEGYQIASSNSLLSATSTNTVYYIENRQQEGWDAHLPGHGMLIWKVTYNENDWYYNTPNTTSTLRYMLVTAGGNANNIGFEEDAFPGTKNKTSWSGVSGKPLKNITESNGVITLTYINNPTAEDPETPDTPVTSGGTITLLPSDFTAITDTEFVVEKSGVTLHCSKGTIADQFRFFKSQTATISSTVGNIVSIEITCTANDNAKYGPGSFGEQEGYTYSEKVGTWTGDAESVEFATTYNQVRATQIVVTLAETTETPETPEEPETPDTPETPEEPETPETPDTPEEPETPETLVLVFDADIDLGNASTGDPSEYTISKDGVTLNVGLGKIGMTNNENHYRIYKGMDLTITSTVGNVTSVEFACTVAGDEKYGPGNFTVSEGEYSYAEKVGTWTGDTDSVVFTSTHNQVRATQIVVTITSNTDTPETPEEPETPDTPENPEEPETPAGMIIFDADVDMGDASMNANNQSEYTIEKDGVEIYVSTGIIGAYNGENHYRIYKNQTLTLTSTKGNIVAIEFSCTANDDEKYGPGCFTVNTGDYSYYEEIGNWVGSARSVEFLAESNQVRAKQIIVTLASTPTDIEDMQLQQTPVKIMRDGQIIIVVGNKLYNILGTQVQ